MSTRAPETDESVALRAAQGVLLYVVFLEPREGAGNRSNLRSDHHHFISDLDQQGRLFASGPVVDETTGKSAGHSVFIIRAGSLAEAEETARKEPFVLNGIKTFTVRPWRLVIGEAWKSAQRAD